MQRQSRGEPPLPEEDLSKLFKPPQAPARMDSLLIAGIVSLRTMLVLIAKKAIKPSVFQGIKG
jgi:hypothetical protein